jgi:hypothetical protein
VGEGNIRVTHELSRDREAHFVDDGPELSSFRPQPPIQRAPMDVEIPGYLGRARLALHQLSTEQPTDAISQFWFALALHGLDGRKRGSRAQS